MIILKSSKVILWIINVIFQAQGLGDNLWERSKREEGLFNVLFIHIIG